MNYNHIVIASNGEFKNIHILTEIIKNADMLIAADGGCNWLDAQNIVPDMIIGDMDSISSDTLNKMKQLSCEILYYPTKKNETDTELSLLKAIEMKAHLITIIGALGFRIDHAIANISLLSMPCTIEENICIFDGYSYIYLTNSSIKLNGNIGDLVSLIPFSDDTHGVVTKGLEYSLKNESLFSGRSRGISNVMTENTANISLQKGVLMVVHNKQKIIPPFIIS